MGAVQRTCEPNCVWCLRGRVSSLVLAAAWRLHSARWRGGDVLRPCCSDRFHGESLAPQENCSMAVQVELPVCATQLIACECTCVVQQQEWYAPIAICLVPAEHGNETMACCRQNWCPVHHSTARVLFALVHLAACKQLPVQLGSLLFHATNATCSEPEIG